jgi:hypothetical protein
MGKFTFPRPSPNGTSVLYDQLSLGPSFLFSNKTTPANSLDPEFRWLKITRSWIIPPESGWIPKVQLESRFRAWNMALWGDSHKKAPNSNKLTTLQTKTMIKTIPLTGLLIWFLLRRHSSCNKQPQPQQWQHLLHFFFFFWHKMTPTALLFASFNHCRV